MAIFDQDSQKLQLLTAEILPNVCVKNAALPVCLMLKIPADSGRLSLTAQTLVSVPSEHSSTTNTFQSHAPE